MKQVQRGFTLIELVMVIVILGVLAAVAIPKFVDLKGDAQLAAVKSTAGAAAAASTINYAACAVASAAASGTTSATCLTLANCNAIGGLLSGGLPAIYTPTGGAIGKGASVTCTLTLTGATPAVTANFEAIGASL